VGQPCSFHHALHAASFAINLRSKSSRSYIRFLHLAAMAESTDFMPKRDQYCDRCWSMTTTSDGLSALTSRKGYIFYNWEESTESGVTGCLLCKWIWDVCKDRLESWGDDINKTDAFQLRWNKPISIYQQYSLTRLLLRSPISGPGGHLRMRLLSWLLRKDPLTELHITVRPEGDYGKFTYIPAYISDGI
jgi:hypothetical protein